MISQVTVEAASELLQGANPPMLIDVREPGEFAICRLPGGVLIPLGELARRVDEIEVEPERAIIVYCHHGIRSLSGAAILQRAGFANVASMHGGIEAWSVRIDPSVPRY